jgi:hypothetical protein
MTKLRIVCIHDNGSSFYHSKTIMQIKLSTLQKGFQIVATLFADIEALFISEQASASSNTSTTSATATAATIPPVQTPVVNSTSPSA